MYQEILHITFFNIWLYHLNFNSMSGRYSDRVPLEERDSPESNDNYSRSRYNHRRKKYDEDYDHEEDSPISNKHFASYNSKFENPNYEYEHDEEETKVPYDSASDEKYNGKRKFFGTDFSEKTPKVDDNYNFPSLPAVANMGFISPCKRIDYVLVYRDKTAEEATDKDSRLDLEHKIDAREKFERLLQEKHGIEIQKEVIGQNVFVKIHTAFPRLCAEAELVKLEMPLVGVSKCKQYLFEIYIYNLRQSSKLVLH